MITYIMHDFVYFSSPIVFIIYIFMLSTCRDDTSFRNLSHPLARTKLYE